MKPRIFFFSAESEFFGRLLADLRDLVPFFENDQNGSAFIHVGFNSPSREAVQQKLDGLPDGLYASLAFANSMLSDGWKFSKCFAEDPDGSGICLVTNSPLSGANASLEALQFLDQLEAIENKVSAVGDVRSIKDELLADHIWSVRTSNVFVAHKIKHLSELINYSAEELLSLRNFGRKSLAEITKFLNERQLSLRSPDKREAIRFEHSSVADQVQVELNNFWDDLVDEFSQRQSERISEILLKRSGINGNKTLEELGKEYGITRERIRQLESKGIGQVLVNRNNKLEAWYQRVKVIVEEAPFPISCENLKDLEPNFQAERPITNLVKFVISTVNKHRAGQISEPMNLIFHQGEFFPMMISDEDLADLRNSLIKTLSVSTNGLLQDVKHSFERDLPKRFAHGMSLVWQEQMQNCLIKTNERGEKLFLKYVRSSKIERGAQFLIDKIKSSAEPQTTTALRVAIKTSKIGVSPNSVFNKLSDYPDVFPAGHGLWGCIDHISLSDHDCNLIVKTATDMVEQQPEVQVHAREVLKKTSAGLENNLNYFEVAGVLHNYSELVYLGRSVFASKYSGIAKRVHIHDVMVKVLKEAGEPLHHSELILRTKKYVSVNEDYAAVFIPKPPIVNLGRNTFALDFWADE